MAKNKKKPAHEPTFEDSLAELEEVVSALEGGELGLDEALKQYELGVAGLKRCHQQLQSAERRIELLSGVDAEGNPVTQPFDEEDAPTADSPAGARAKKRSRQGPRASEPGVDDGRGLF